MQPSIAVCGVLADYRGVQGEGCVIAEDGAIIGITGSPPAAQLVLDYRGQGVYVTPGFIDLHVHLRGLLQSYKEDEYSGTAAAASSGITMVVDMPNTQPRLATLEALDAKLAALREQSVTDYSVYAGVPGSIEEVRKLASRPIAGFKVYPDDLAHRLDVVHYILGLNNVLVVVHPELPEAEKPIIESNTLRSLHRGCHWETAAVDLIASLRPRARVHITHVSCPSTLEHARAYGFTVDITPHHLLLENGEDCLLRVNPPLRSRAEQTHLLKKLLEGEVDAIASDHAPHTWREKLEPLSCRPGIPWLEAWPQMLYCLVEAGALKLQEYLWLASQGPAKILGLNGYGVLEPGARANITVFKPATGRVHIPHWSKAKQIPYFMEKSCMDVVATIVGGSIVYNGYKISSDTNPINPYKS